MPSPTFTIISLRTYPAWVSLRNRLMKIQETGGISKVLIDLNSAFAALIWPPCWKHRAGKIKCCDPNTQNAKRKPVSNTSAFAPPETHTAHHPHPKRKTPPDKIWRCFFYNAFAKRYSAASGSGDGAGSAAAASASASAAAAAAAFARALRSRVSRSAAIER